MSWNCVWEFISYPAFVSLCTSGSIFLICWCLYRINKRIISLQEQIIGLHQLYFDKWVKATHGEDVNIQ